MIRLLPLMATIVAAIPAASRAADDCRHEAERTAVVDAADARLLEIVARAGHLSVEGREDLQEARVRARACASDEDTLDEIQLRAERRGDSIRIEAVMPGSGWFGSWGRNDARLDMFVEAPAGIVSDIEDTSGGIELRSLGALTLDDSSGAISIDGITGFAEIEDSSGAISVRNVRGPVRINDSSGGIVVTEIGGDVRIDDSSGGIDVRGVEGAVDVWDSSGSIEVADAVGSVTVHRDSSGSIDVRNIEGDFIVRRDSSGGIHHRNVSGTVRTPDR